MRYLLRALLAGSLGLAAALLVACGGGSGLLSANQATSLSTQLDQVSSAVGAGQCSAADSAVNGFSNSVDNLTGTGVNSKLVANLKQGAGVVQQLVTQCQSSSSSTSSTTASSISTSSSPTSTSTTSSPTSTSSSTSSSPTTTSSATSSSPSGTTSNSGSGGAGLGGGGGSGGGGIGGNGNGP